jgi:hypothetical protein
MTERGHYFCNKFGVVDQIVNFVLAKDGELWQQEITFVRELIRTKLLVSKTRSSIAPRSVHSAHYRGS